MHLSEDSDHKIIKNQQIFLKPNALLIRDVPNDQVNIRVDKINLTIGDLLITIFKRSTDKVLKKLLQVY